MAEAGHGGGGQSEWCRQYPPLCAGCVSGQKAQTPLAVKCGCIGILALSCQWIEKAFYLFPW